MTSRYEPSPQGPLRRRGRDGLHVRAEDQQRQVHEGGGEAHRREDLDVRVGLEQRLDDQALDQRAQDEEDDDERDGRDVRVEARSAC